VKVELGKTSYGAVIVNRTRQGHSFYESEIDLRRLYVVLNGDTVDDLIVTLTP